MSEVIVIPDGLKRRFANFGKLELSMIRLRSIFDAINAANLTAGGVGDEFAKAYHEQVVAPTSDLVSTLHVISQRFGVADVTGRAAATEFEDADAESTRAMGT